MSGVQAILDVNSDLESEDSSHPPGWVMSMRWLDLLFAHWPVDPADLAPLIPKGLELDLHDGKAWVGIVPFKMTRIHARGLPPVPAFRAFAETNLRTYVKCNGRPGVFFISLDAPHWIAVKTAQRVFHLPYVYSKVKNERRGEWVSDETIRNEKTKFVARYRLIGEKSAARPGSIEYFLTERYCLFARGKGEEIVMAEIHHEPWQLQAAEAEIEANTLAEAYGIRLPGEKPLLHFSRYIHAVAWMPKIVPVCER